MRRKTEIHPDKLYDIIPSQNAMYLMYKFGIHKQQAQIPTSFSVDEDLDFAVLQRAFHIEIKRNDCLRLKFIRQNGQIKQYFSESYSYNVPVKYFFSVEEQNDFFNKDAPKPVSFMKGETFRIYFYKTAHNGSGVYTNFSHMIADAMGIMVFYMDLFKVYEALKNKTPLPKPLAEYKDYVSQTLEKSSNEEKNLKHEKFFREYFSKGGKPFYAGVHGPGLLEEFRKKKKDPDAGVPMAYNPLYDKCDMEVLSISGEDTKKIFDFCSKSQISPEGVFQLGIRTYCSAINYRTEDVSFMAVCSNRSTVKSKRMSGCMAQPLIFRTLINENATFSEALKYITELRHSLYRHSSYPYTKARDMFLDMFDLGPIQGANSMMFSWIPLPLDTGLPYTVDFSTYNLRSYFTPLYTMVTPDIKNRGIKIYYMYRTKFSDKSCIEALHKNMVKIIIKGIENPDINISQLLDSVDYCLDADA